MINPSMKFINAFNGMDTKNWITGGTVTTLSGEVINLDNSVINSGGLSIKQSLGGSEFEIGYCAENQLILQLRDQGQYEETNLKYAIVRPFIGLSFKDGTAESFQRGTYHVSNVEYKTGYVELTCLDHMCLLDHKVEETIANGTALSVINAICIKCGVSLAKANFDGYTKQISFSTDKSMTDYTYRELLGFVCQCICKYAYFNSTGGLVIDWYPDFIEDYDGGTYDTEDIPYSDGDAVDGGTFSTVDTPYSDGDTADGGTFEALQDYDMIYSLRGFSHDTNDIIITGITVTGADEESSTYGEEGYVLEISDNPYMMTGTAEWAEYIGSKCIGLRFRVLDTRINHNPLIECGDRAYVIDRKQNVYKTYITSLTYKILGECQVKCEAASEEEQNVDQFSIFTKAVIKAREETEKIITAYDVEIQRLSELMANSLGLYHTEQVLSDGSTIFYLHNHASLDNSTIIWKMTADAFAVSTDGGKTWNSGMTASGNAVFQILTAIGINADWINAGTITGRAINNGNGTFSVSSSGVLTASNANITNGNIDLSTTDTIAAITVRSANQSDQGKFKLTNYNLFGYNPNGLTTVEIINTWNGHIMLHNANGCVGSYTDSLVSVSDTSGHYSSINVNGMSTSGTKSRIAATKDYGKRLLYCYETPSPMFGDIGEGRIDDTGKCLIFLDDKFAETIDTDCQYQVFLQNYGDGKSYVTERNGTYFSVEGTPDMRFGWEIKAVQKSYDTMRLEEFTQPESIDVDTINETYNYLESLLYDVESEDVA